MLQIRHVSKVYQTGKLTQRALDDVSLNLRDSEFVAILGPSGSGKTTLLNIIGGLDRCDSGSLSVNGTSTEKYRDRDWDSYRNHAVGFVFQSYNLIPHQTLLSNVELALTISGIGRAERKKRAMDALEKVGLADQAQKRPAQISGGQMQRVSIARALVNNPDILLADEPTGALDSDTSLQVMELLREVAKDRLVVLVTHNAELADCYATRIIRLRDGKICADSNPFEPDAGEGEPPSHGSMGKSSMSLPTAVSLSFNNLRTKRMRTILTAFAGSIGIIGIALILSISSGVTRYVDEMEAEMVREYPLEIERAYYDISAYVNARSGGSLLPGTPQEDSAVSDRSAIDITSLIYNIFAGQASNDLVSLEDYLKHGGSGIEDDVVSIEYSYDITPQIYQDNTESVVQVHPDHFFDVLGFGSTTSSNSIMSSLVSTDIFSQMPESKELYDGSYTVLAGRWPESWNECVMVMSDANSTTDLALYTVGLRDTVEMEDMISQFIRGDVVEKPEIDETYTYDDFLGTNFKLVNNADLYEYNSEYQVWEDKSDDEAYMQGLVDAGENLTVVGIVTLNDDEEGGILNSGFDYLPSLVDHLAGEAAESEIVRQQLANPDINVFTNEPFGEEDSAEEFDLRSLFDVDEDALRDMLQIDEGSLDDVIAGIAPDLVDSLNPDDDLAALDLSGLVDLSSIDPELPEFDLDMGELTRSIEVTASEEDMERLGENLLSGYQSYAAGDPRMDFSQLGNAFAEYSQSEDARDILTRHIPEIMRESGAMQLSADSVRTLLADVLTDFFAWGQEKGETDFSGDTAILDEYLQTERAQEITGAWADENLQFDLSGVDVSEEEMESLSTDLMAGYQAWAAAEGNVPDPTQIGNYFTAYLATEDAQEIMAEGLEGMIDTGSLEAQIEDAIQSYAESAAGSVMAQAEDQIEAQVEEQTPRVAGEVTAQIQDQIEEELERSMDQIGASLEDAIDIDASALLDAFTIDMDVSDLLELLSSLTGTESNTYEGNLETLGYTDFKSPDSISIYPKDFESKDKVVEILDDYNDRMEAEGEPDKVISYSDQVGSIMSMITQIVMILSYVLIAFVAISLVVSSIMIGVITYISVLERRQEIGILRAIGASRRNISQVFNAETGIIGLAAGVLGIVITLILILPINMIIHRYSGIYELNAYLQPRYAVILIILSVALTLLSGMLPSRKASRSDPVEALRRD